jgi:hypothetical protein
VTIEIRRCGPDEVAACLAPIYHYFGRDAVREDDL